MQQVRSSIRAARDTTFGVDGVLYLFVDFGGHEAIIIFGVDLNMNTELILGNFQGLRRSVDKLPGKVVTLSISSIVLKTKVLYVDHKYR